MPEINISIDPGKSAYLLGGDIDVLRSNRRARTYLQTNLGVQFRSRRVLEVPYSEENREQVLQKIQRTLERFGIAETRSEAVEIELKELLDEQRRFLEFSEKARRIWQNEVDPVEFKQFVNIINRALKGRTLYDLQLLAAFHLAFSQNACNFSVPGAGKTSVVYAAYSYLSSLPSDSPKYVNKILVIGPLSSFGPWETEFQECFLRPARSQRLSGNVPISDRLRHLYSERPDVRGRELSLITYQALPGLLEDISHYLTRPDNNVMVVLDEAHRIKNTEGGVWADAALSLAKMSRSRVVLTGTPAPNGYQDIYNLFKFIWPDRNVVGYNISNLADMSCNPFDVRVERLIDNVAPFFIRITKRDLRIPPATEHEPVYVSMGPIQREIYDFVERHYLGSASPSKLERNVKSSLAQAKLIRLMQAASNPQMLRNPISDFIGPTLEPQQLYIDDANIVNKIADYENIELAAKFARLKQITAKLVDRGHRVVVWATFVDNINAIRTLLQEEGISTEVLYGETPTAALDDSDYELTNTREGIIRRFHDSESDLRVVVANAAAVGESISLHKTCHVAVYFERNFAAGPFLQSKDRIHRYGLSPGQQTHYYYLLSANSIDETIHRRLNEKVELMMRAIESKSIPLIDLNRDYDEDLDDDFKAVIRDYLSRALEAP